MKPGDLIKWYYDHNNEIVRTNEELWSSLMQKWVPIGIVSTLLHQDNKTYSWINSKGCFRARVDDIENIPVILYREIF
jgi:hypothetical protein